MTTQRARTLLIAGMLLAPGMAGAHHSFAMFDANNPIEKTGVIKEVQWNNPHVWFTMVTTDEKGAPDEWSVECGATQTLLRQGWKRDSLKLGETVTARVRPMRNGAHSGAILSVKLQDGTLLTQGVQGARPDGETQ